MNILETIIPKKFAKKTFANSKFKVDDTTWYRLFFDKEEDQCWYIRIPEWPYSHHNLMMVAGADDLCEFFSHDNKAIVFVSPSKAEHTCTDSLNDGLIYKKETSSLTGGATYKLVNIYNELADEWGIPKTIWLCPVTLFVFGKYPEYYDNIRVYETKPEIFNWGKIAPDEGIFPRGHISSKDYFPGDLAEGNRDFLTKDAEYNAAGHRVELGTSTKGRAVRRHFDLYKFHPGDFMSKWKPVNTDHTASLPSWYHKLLIDFGLNTVNEATKNNIIAVRTPWYVKEAVNSVVE